MAQPQSQPPPPTPPRSTDQVTAQRSAPGWATSSPPRAAVAAVPPAENNTVDTVTPVPSTRPAPATSTVPNPPPPSHVPSSTSTDAPSAAATSQPLPPVIHVADPGIAAFLRRATEAATRRSQTPVPETTTSAAGDNETAPSVPTEADSAKKRPPALDIDAANTLAGASANLSLSTEDVASAQPEDVASGLPRQTQATPGTSSSAAIDLTADSPTAETPNAPIGDADLFPPNQAEQSQGVYPAAHMSAGDYAFGTTDSAAASCMPTGAATATTEPAPMPSTSGNTASPAQSITTAASSVHQGLTPASGAATVAPWPKLAPRPGFDQSSLLQRQAVQGSLTPQHQEQRAQWLVDLAAQRGQGSQSAQTQSSQWNPQMIAASHQKQPQQQQQQQQQQQAPKPNTVAVPIYLPQQADHLTSQQLTDFMQKQAAATKRLWEETQMQSQQQTQQPQIQQPQVQQPQGQQQQALQHLQHLAQQQVSQHPQQLYQQPQQQNAPQYTREEYKQLLWQQAHLKAQQAQQQQQQQQARQQAQQQQHAQQQQRAQRQQPAQLQQYSQAQHTQQFRQQTQPAQAVTPHLSANMQRPTVSSSAPPTSTHFVQNGRFSQGTNQTPPITKDDMLAVQTAALQARLADAAAQRETLPPITQPGVNSAPPPGSGSSQVGHHSMPQTPQLDILQHLQNELQAQYRNDKEARKNLAAERNKRFGTALAAAVAVYDEALDQADNRTLERSLAFARDALCVHSARSAERVSQLEADLQREQGARSKAEMDRAAVQRLLDDQKQMYQRDVGTLRNEVAQSKTKLDEQSQKGANQAASVSASLQAQKTEHDKAIAPLRLALVNSEQMRIKLQKELDELKTSHSQCQDRIHRNNAKMAELADAETRHVANAVAAARTEAENEINALKRKNERESATAKRDVNKADKLVRELKAKCVDLEAKHTELEEGLRRETARADAAEQKCAAQAAELEVAREHLSDFESGARVKELEDDVERLVANKTRLQQDLERAQMTAQHNAEQVQAVAEAVDFVSTKAGFTFPSVAARELTAEQSAKAVSILNRVVMGLMAARDRANERKGRDRGADVKQLQRSCDELLLEKDKLVEERDALRRELDAAKEKVKAAEKQSQIAAPASRMPNTTPAKSTSATPANKSTNATLAAQSTNATPQTLQKETAQLPSGSAPQTSRAMNPPATPSSQTAEPARATSKTAPTATPQAPKATTSTTAASAPTTMSAPEAPRPSTPRRRNDRDTATPVTPLAGTKRLPADTPEGEIPPSQRRRLGLTPSEEDLFKWIRENHAVFHGRKPTPETPSHCKLCLVEYGRSHPKVAVEERPMTPFGSEDPEDIAQHLLLEHARQIAMIREDRNRARRKSSVAR